MTDDARPGLVIGHQYTPLRQPFRTARADLYGGAVAQHELIEAILAYTTIDALHIFLPPSSGGSPALDHGLSALQARFGATRLVATCFSELPRLASQVPYVCVNQGYLSTAFAQLRRATRLSFPICAIQHSCHASSRFAFPQSLDAFLAMDESDVLVTVSRAGRQTIDRLFEMLAAYLGERLGVHATFRGRIVEIPLGLDTDRYAPLDKRTCRRVLDIAPDTVVLLYVGRFAEDHKADLEPLLLVLRRLLRRHRDVLLLLAGREGDEQYGKYLQSTACHLGVASHIRIVADFPHFAKLVLYSAADLFVSPVDNVQETFGLALIEAMAAGLPVVAADWSGYRDIVVDGETGFLVSSRWSRAAAEAITPSAMLYQDHYAERYVAQRTGLDLDAMQAALERLVCDSSLRERFGAAARTRATTEFNLRHLVRRLEEVWREQRERSPRRSHASERTVIEFERMYAHFATSAFDLDGRLAPSDDCQELLDVLLPAQRLPAGVSPRQIRNIVEACRAEPRSPRRMISDGMADSATLLAWLAKKGYLRPVGGSVAEQRLGPGR